MLQDRFVNLSKGKKIYRIGPRTGLVRFELLHFVNDKYKQNLTFTFPRSIFFIRKNLTFCVSALGSQLWLMNLEMFPLLDASMKYSEERAMKQKCCTSSLAYFRALFRNCRGSNTSPTYSIKKVSLEEKITFISDIRQPSEYQINLNIR